MLLTKAKIIKDFSDKISFLLTGKTKIEQKVADMDEDLSKKASTEYVDKKVADLVNGAPEQLDTLQELSKALNNDTDFATTVNKSLAEKLPLTGGKIDGNLEVSGAITGGHIVANMLLCADARGDNRTPEWYMHGGAGQKNELKTKNIIGIDGTKTLVEVSTYVPWNTADGGYPMQIARDSVEGKVYVRYGLTSVTWSDWKTVAFTSDKAAAAVTADTAKSVAWENITGRPKYMKAVNWDPETGVFELVEG